MSWTFDYIVLNMALQPAAILVVFSSKRNEIRINVITQKVDNLTVLKYTYSLPYN